jgi:rhodanese-related sulfurtransferase
MKSMKLSRVLVVSLLVVTPLLSSCGNSSSSDTTEPVGKISLILATKVIDVRSADEFASGHISGATHLDFEAGALEEALPSLDKDAAYSVYCRSGRRSALAVKLMSDAGFTNVTDLGGIEVAAKTLALPIVTK